MRRMPPHGKEKCGSPRVTLRLHQLKEKKEKVKNNSQMSTDHMEFNSSNAENGGKVSQQSTEDQSNANKENADDSNKGEKKETAMETNQSSPDTTVEVQSAPVKRTHSTEDDDDGRKKRRKEEKGKSGSTSGGSPKSALGVESEGEEPKSVESPGPKVPPLKIVISGGSLEETGSGGRNGKAGSGRHHLPYVVASSTETEATSPSAPTDESDRGGSAGSGEENATGPGSGGSAGSGKGAHHQRVLRSHRGKKTSESRSSKEPKESSTKDSASTGVSSPAEVESTTSPRQVSPTPAASETTGEAEEPTSTVTTPATPSVNQAPSSNPPAEEPTPQPPPPPPPAPQATPQELHPRKRKIRPKDNQNNSNNTSAANLQNSGNNGNGSAASPADGNGNTSENVPLHLDSISNSYQLFLNIRKQIERKRKGLFPVQPKPPQGFKDYLMNRCTYVLANNTNSRVPPPMASPPANLPAGIKDLFISQEKERHRLLMQHVIEKEKLVLSVEQEILRVHGRAARALANQSLPFSACTILRDEEVYSAITPEQEEKDRNARSRYNGRLFLSWLQDVDDKWEKIKEAMLLRHHNEAESLHAVQKMDWEWKMKEVGMCELKAAPVIEDSHVPMVHVSDDFDLLPA